MLALLSRRYSATAGAVAGPFSPLRPLRSGDLAGIRNSIADYLVASPCSFSPSDAAKLAVHLSHLKSTAKPESVLRFFRSHGFDAPNVRKLVSWNPRLLCCDTQRSLAPKFQSLLQLGFTKAEIIEIIMSNPCVLTRDFQRTIMPKLELWTAILGSREAVIKLFKMNQWFLSYNVDKNMMPNLALLRECGIKDDRIALLLRKLPRFIYQSSDSLRSLIERADQYGVSRKSGFFIWALDMLFRNSKANFEAKRNVLMKMGWSESEFLNAFSKAPQLLSNSSLLLQKKMDFLINEAGCEASYVANRPVLLTISLQRRLIPRWQVIKLLKSKEVYSIKCNFSTLMIMTDKLFMEKFIHPYMEEVPEIHNIFVSRCGKQQSD